MRGLRHSSLDLTRRSKLFSISTLKSDQIPTTYSNGQTLVDGGDLFIKRGVYTLPEALVPRFGRQDIPMHTRTSGDDSFLDGLNHIFADKVAVSDEVFNIVGGVSNVGNQGVEPILFDTLGNYGEYAQSLATVNAIPECGKRRGRHCR